MVLSWGTHPRSGALFFETGLGLAVSVIAHSRAATKNCFKRRENAMK